MFRIRVFTPPVRDDEGWLHAGAELTLGPTRGIFLVDLTHWSVRDYERQWREGIARFVQGASSSALMIAYRGPGEGPHVMWALWRDDERVWIQQQSVLPAELDGPFDPLAPYAHVGERVAVSEHGLPIPEWHVDLVHLHAAALGIRWPIYPA